MRFRSRPRPRRAVWSGASSAAAAAWLLAGCQSYERAPLDLAAHRESLSARMADAEPVAAFAERLRATDAAAPERFDLADGLSPAEGEALALFYNADLRLVRLEAGVALATFETAGLWEDPVFGFDAEDIVSNASPLEFGLTLSLTIPISGRLEVEKARAGAAYEAELRRIVDVEWSVRLGVRRAWAAWTAAEERATALQAAGEQVQGIVEITDRLEFAGELSRVEGRLFRVEMADRRAALAQAELLARRARFDLLGLMGLPAEAGVVLLPALPAADAPRPDDPVASLMESNTELAVKHAEYEVAEETLRLEVREQYPDLTIGSGYGSQEDDDRVLFGASLPIPILNANRAAIAEARARRETARAAAEATLERLAREYAAASAEFEAAHSQRARYESEILPMLEDQAADLAQIVRLGQVDTLLLLEAVERQFEARSRLIDLRLAELSAAITMKEILGPEQALDPAPVAAPHEEPGSAKREVEAPAGNGGSQ